MQMASSAIPAAKRRSVDRLEALVLRHALELMGIADRRERDRRLSRIAEGARVDALAMGGSRPMADEWSRTLVSWVRAVVLSIECDNQFGTA
jgi:hypothetical protein